MNPLVIAIMITGKDQMRIELARNVGIRNFDEQDYPNKKMVIVNHGNEKVLPSARNDIHEIMVDKAAFSLGDLRNIALELVPINALWYVHDDDDIRHPKYVSYMVDNLLKNKAVAVFMKYRLEYNLTNGYSFVMKFEGGTTHVMAMKLDRLRYLDVDTLEDVNLQDDLKAFKKKYVLLDNDPRMYIRTIHNSNTSPFAISSRDSLRPFTSDSMYKEYNITEKQKEYVERAVQKYYGVSES